MYNFQIIDEQPEILEFPSGRILSSLQSSTQIEGNDLDIPENIKQAINSLKLKYPQEKILKAIDLSDIQDKEKAKQYALNTSQKVKNVI